MGNYSPGWQFLFNVYGSPLFGINSNGKRYKIRDGYILSTFTQGYTSAALAAAATDTFTIPVGADHHLLILGHNSYPDAGNFDLTVNVLDRDLQNQQMHNYLYGSPTRVLANLTGLHNREWTWPYAVKAGGQIRGTITNGADADNTVRLAFDCVKLFPQTQAGLEASIMSGGR